VRIIPHPGILEKTLELKSLVESLLFVADRTVTAEILASALEVPVDDVETALQALDADYQTRGIRLQRNGNRLQLVSAQEAGPYIERFLGLELSGKLSSAALETLSIVAYRQPATRAQVEAIRGVSSDSVLRSLVRRGLLEEVGRSETVGRPILYGTTFEFLQHFGLRDVRDLPDWGELDASLQARETDQS
jgi:segregation and condensation protein B